jgi:1-acyl-sn-glycerol-3-phosphate acyltransferase
MKASRGLLMILEDAPAEVWRPTARRIRGGALHGLNAVDRALLRAVALAGRANIGSISGAEYIAVDRDPFILALNHNTRLESLFVPALLILLREGRRIHFLADWNFRMIPGVNLLYRRAGVITVPNKRARPRFLNPLKPVFIDPMPPMQRARELLLAGASIGIFPEGKVNRDPARLLRGRLGVARLSIETGVPVVPAGLQLAPAGAGLSPGASARINIVIGVSLEPPPATGVDTAEVVYDWHAQIMTAIGNLSGKIPAIQTRRRSDEAARADQNQARPVGA